MANRPIPLRTPPLVYKEEDLLQLKMETLNLADGETNGAPTVGKMSDSFDLADLHSDSDVSSKAGSLESSHLSFESCKSFESFKSQLSYKPPEYRQTGYDE